jgi:hypothetical protein
MGELGVHYTVCGYVRVSKDDANVYMGERLGRRIEHSPTYPNKPIIFMILKIRVYVTGDYNFNTHTRKLIPIREMSR